MNMPRSQTNPCPCCGGVGDIRHTIDQDGCDWYHIQCRDCGLRTRGKWVSHSSDTCPNFYAEVREEWNRRPGTTMADAVHAGNELLLKEQAALLRECRAALDDLIDNKKPGIEALVCGSTTLGYLRASLFEHRPRAIMNDYRGPGQ